MKQIIVVKIGTDLVHCGYNSKNSPLRNIVRELCKLKREDNIDFLIVSSGAIGCGMDLLGISYRPKELPIRQALASIGQVELMKRYTELFKKYSGNQIFPAQILLTATDLENRISYVNILNTIHQLFSLGNTIPIVNENDTTATEEIKFGDNDTLSARIAVRINASLLIILTNVDGLYTENPKSFPKAELISKVRTLSPQIFAYAKGTDDEYSVGGMITKLEAVKIAWRAGIPSVIANGHRKGIITQILKDEAKCTMFIPPKSTLSHKKKWIAFGKTVKGKIFIDEGAKNALLKKGSSLLPVGISTAEGNFKKGDCVSIYYSNEEIGRGIVNIDIKNLMKIKGKKTSDIRKEFSELDIEEVIHRDNMILFSD
ncbi:MAG: glutamate 5-kinase [Candidatus Hydrogenedentes bacterium]|nr:glutamate 5-kinase [Candidatus Hydrogenedentota bacterium]